MNRGLHSSSLEYARIEQIQMTFQGGVQMKMMKIYLKLLFKQSKNLLEIIIPFNKNFVIFNNIQNIKIYYQKFKT